MINIVSTYLLQRGVSGPVKVVRNLMKGLERIGHPYVVNRCLGSTRWLWIHCDLRALLELPDKGTINVLGPNMVELPQDLPTRRRFPSAVYLLPCQWLVDLWTREGYSQSNLQAWPVGIDTEEFQARVKIPRNGPVLVYYKQRRPENLARVEGVLKRMRMPYAVIVYGCYQQAYYQSLLNECSFVLWVGTHETQGIALQEALASDVPVLVWDVCTLSDQYPFPSNLFPSRLLTTPATAVPYFDSRCGLVIRDPAQIEAGVSQMREELPSFRPREFVVENLSLEKQAGVFVRFFEELEEAARCAPAPSDVTCERPYRPRPATRLHLKFINESRALRRVFKHW